MFFIASLKLPPLILLPTILFSFANTGSLGYLSISDFLRIREGFNLPPVNLLPPKLSIDFRISEMYEISN